MGSPRRGALGPRGPLLALGALAFLVHGGEAFARLGRSDGARVALASCEIAGAVLFLLRRTLLPGAAVLIGVLAWALGFHFALGKGTRNLWIDLGAVIVLGAAARALRTARSG